MTIIVVSDIFGITSSLKAFAGTLEQTGYKTILVDPYDGVEHDFPDEEKAYTYFMHHVGLVVYAQHLEHVIVNGADNVDDNQLRGAIKALVGFSIGASAIWQVSANKCMKKVEQAFCFYGSQMRYNAEIQPKVKSTVVFPESELHFSVEDLQNKIEMTPNVSTIRCSYLHGFMNTHSVNFNQSAYNHYIGWLCNKITGS